MCPQQYWEGSTPPALSTTAGGRPPQHYYWGGSTPPGPKAASTTTTTTQGVDPPLEVCPVSKYMLTVPPVHIPAHFVN
jgi:hypothetical protein